MNENTEISNIIINTINIIFQNLFSSIDSKLYDILDNLAFINTDILKDKYFSNIFGTSTTSGILLISNSLLIGIIIYFSIKFLMSRFIDNKIESPIQFIFKLLIFGICMNSAYFIIEQIIKLNFNISAAIMSIGEDIFGKKICFSSLIYNINLSLSKSNELNIFTIEGITTGAIITSLLNLVFSYSVRYIMVKIFILLSPFAFLSLCLESTSWFFRAWSKNLFSLLLVQIIISIILVIIFSMDYESHDLLTKYLYIGAISCLIKVNSIVKEFIGGISTEIRNNIQGLKIGKR